MKKQAISFESDLTGLDRNNWCARILEIGDALGSSQKLGNDYIAVHLDAGPNLIVTFENGQQLRRTTDSAEPVGFAYTRRDGWSTLSIIAAENGLFRDQAIYDYIDELTDDGFFDAYDNVLFFGEGAGGYAASAYSVAAPGSTVLAFSPFATLTPRLASFDGRTSKTRRIDFTSRYGFAPAMIEAAQHAFVIYNQKHRVDATHAAMFKRDNVTLIPVNGTPQPLKTRFEDLDILEDLIRAAMAGSLSTQIFAEQFRERRENAPYLRELIKSAMESGHSKLALKACTLALNFVEDEELQALQQRLTETTATDDKPKAVAN